MRVLVVENEPGVRSSLRRGLTAQGYRVDTAGDGIDGLRKATENSYDVVVLDVALPGLDGSQVCRRLRAAGRWTPILMLTARDDDVRHAAVLDSGADDCLSKPFSLPVLLAHLRSLTRRALGARPTVLTAARLSLDPASRIVSRDGVPLDLTSREVAVLEHLLRREGRVVAKSELLEHCWEASAECDPAVVEVLVHRLRRKIEAPGGRAVVETLRSEGYIVRTDSMGPEQAAASVQYKVLGFRTDAADSERVL
jgi:two-component system, OmpR family, response regulator